MNNRPSTSIWMAAALIAGSLLLTGCAANTIKVERNLGPKPISERARDLKSAPEPTAAEYVGRGDAAYAAGDHDKAIVEYVNSLVGAPESPESIDTLAKIARAHLDAGHVDVAESTFRQVLKLRADDAGAHEGLGLALMNGQRPDEAAAELEAALAADPTRWRALNGLGIIHDVAGRTEIAKTYYFRALETVPRSSEVLNNLGYSFYLSGDFRGASLNFRQAIYADRNNGKAWSNLGLVLARERRYEESLEAFGQLMDRPKALNSVGYVCLLSRNYPCAEQYFSMAMSASPTWYVEAHRNLQQARDQRALPLIP